MNETEKPMGYEHRASERMKKDEACQPHGMQSCVPLKNDPICRACLESDSIKKDLKK